MLRDSKEVREYSISENATILFSLPYAAAHENLQCGNDPCLKVRAWIHADASTCSRTSCTLVLTGNFQVEKVGYLDGVPSEIIKACLLPANVKTKISFFFLKCGKIKKKTTTLQCLLLVIFQATIFKSLACVLKWVTSSELRGGELNVNWVIIHKNYSQIHPSLSIFII